MSDLRIVSDPDICGGDLRLEGTRLTVRFFASIRRYRAVSQVLVQYPHLTVEQVEFVWDWLDEHADGDAKGVLLGEAVKRVDLTDAILDAAELGVTEGEFVAAIAREAREEWKETV